MPNGAFGKTLEEPTIFAIGRFFATRETACIFVGARNREASGPTAKTQQLRPDRSSHKILHLARVAFLGKVLRIESLRSEIEGLANFFDFFVRFCRGKRIPVQAGERESCNLRILRFFFFV